MAFILSPPRTFSATSHPTRITTTPLRPPRSFTSRAPPSRRAHLPRLSMSISVGSAAVDFSLPITGGATLTLADLQAKARTVVMYFYPRDATSGCTVEAQDFRDLAPQLRELDATVVGVSRDSVESHDAFSKDQDLNFPLISDDGTLSEGYDVWKLLKLGDRELMAVQRSTFIIRDGKVIKEWRGVKSGGHAAEVLEALKSL